MKDELPKPTAVETAARSMEMARIWIVDGKQQIVISPNLWKDPAAWGLMLVDFAKHLSRAYVKEGLEPRETLSRIKQAFEVEWTNPTDEPESIA
jgi:hypothetical protein